MERTKLKLAVIFLLVVMNLLLLGSAVVQHRQNVYYARAGITEAMTYLENHGVTAEREVIPWSSTLPDTLEKVRAAEGLLLLGDPMPEGESYTIQPSRRPETMAVDLANGLAGLELRSVTLRSVTEGYRYDDLARTMTPVWQVETDRGTFLLDGGTGTLMTERSLYR